MTDPRPDALRDALDALKQRALHLQSEVSLTAFPTNGEAHFAQAGRARGIFEAVREIESVAARAALGAQPPQLNPDGVCPPTDGTPRLDKPLTAIADMAVDLGDPTLSSTFRQKRRSPLPLREPSERALIAASNAGCCSRHAVGGDLSDEDTHGCIPCLRLALGIAYDVDNKLGAPAPSGVPRDLTDEQLLAAYVAGCNREAELQDAELSPDRIRTGIAATMRAALRAVPEKRP